jgi:hypothetical protein
VGEGTAFAAKGCPTIYTAVRRRASAVVRAQGGTAGGPVGTAGCDDAVGVELHVAGGHVPRGVVLEPMVVGPSRARTAAYDALAGATS